MTTEQTNVVLQHSWCSTTTDLVPADPVREHVRSLQRRKIGRRRVARMAGVPTVAVDRLLYSSPTVTLIPRDLARRLLRCRPTAQMLAPGSLVEATGTRRRLEALMFMGWPRGELARRLRLRPSNLARTRTASQVYVSTARAVAELYDQLWQTPPPKHTHRQRLAVARTRNRARAQGFAPPLAWDDDQIDLPTAQPTGIRSIRR